MSQRLAVCLVAVIACTHVVPGEAADSVTRWGTFGSEPGQLASPWAITARADRVYVADFDNDRIQVFTRAGAFLFAFGSRGTGPGQLRGPAGIALDRDGRVWVADHHNHRIQRFGQDGEFQAEWAAGDADAGPLGLAVDRQGRVYASDVVAGRIRVWEPDGRPMAEWGGLREPWGIALDAAGDLWIADHGGNQIARYGPRGEPRGVLGVTAGALDGPMGLAIAADGSLLVSDLAGGRLQRIDPSGSRLPALDGRGGASALITGLAIDGAEVFAADGGAHQIVRFPTAALAPGLPTTFRLGSIGPSPSRGSITVRMAAPTAGAVTMDVYSIAGRRVWSCPAREVAAGEHQVVWSGLDDRGRPAPAGIYFVRVSFDDGAQRFTRDGRAIVLR